MREFMLCIIYMYFLILFKIIIDINFYVVNLKKDKKKFLIFIIIFFLEMLVLFY